MKERLSSVGKWRGSFRNLLIEKGSKENLWSWTLHRGKSIENSGHQQKKWIFCHLRGPWSTSCFVQAIQVLWSISMERKCLRNKERCSVWGPPYFCIAQAHSPQKKSNQGPASVASWIWHWILILQLLHWFLQGFSQTRHKPSRTGKCQKEKRQEVPLSLVPVKVFIHHLQYVPNSVKCVTNFVGSSTQHFFPTTKHSYYIVIVIIPNLIAIIPPFSSSLKMVSKGKNVRVTLL